MVGEVGMNKLLYGLVGEGKVGLDLGVLSKEEDLQQGQHLPFQSRLQIVSWTLLLYLTHNCSRIAQHELNNILPNPFSLQGRNVGYALHDLPFKLIEMPIPPQIIREDEFLNELHRD